jgi:hypothetical protein
MATTAKRPTLKAVEAAVTVESDNVEFEFDGETYNYSRKKLNSVRLLKAVDENKLTTILVTLLGDKQFDAWLGDDRDMDEITEFAEAAFDAAGTSVGE